MAIYNLNFNNLDNIGISANNGYFWFEVRNYTVKFVPNDGSATVTKYANGIVTTDGYDTYIVNDTFGNADGQISYGIIKHLNSGGDLTGNPTTWTFEGDLPFVAQSTPTPQPEPQPTPTPSSDIDLNSGFFETDLQTNITKYFAESFKLKASDFELVNGVVQINPEKLASITVDLTHIVNTSVETQNLTATNATLGTATANSMTASDITASDITATNSTLGDAKADTIEVENDGLIIKDPAGNKHKFGFTA